MTKVQPTTTYSAQFLDEIRILLEAEKVRLEGELSKFATKVPGTTANYEADFPEFGDEEDDNVHEMEKYVVDKSLEETLESSLRDVIKSLKRLDEGAYGICKYCDQPIDEKRLLARPTSSSCVSCKKTLTQEA